MTQASTPHHIVRQSRPSLREKTRFCEISRDVVFSKLRHFVYRNSTKYTVLCHFWTPFARFCRFFAPLSYATMVFQSDFFGILHRSNIEKCVLKLITLPVYAGYLSLFVVSFVLKHEKGCDILSKKRPSGDGLIRKRSDGRWEGRIVIAYDEKGLPKTKNVLAKTKRECSEKLEKLKAKIGATYTTKCSSEMPFGKWMDYWYRTYCKNTLKEYTQKTYEQRIYKQIIPKIGHLPLNKITTGTLERFYAELKTDGRLVRREQNGNGQEIRLVWR